MSHVEGKVVGLQTCGLIEWKQDVCHGTKDVFHQSAGVRGILRPPW